MRIVLELTRSVALSEIKINLQGITKGVFVFTFIPESEEDHDFLLKGDVFTSDLLEAYISYKRENEVDPARLRPHPYEFTLYFDI